MPTEFTAELARSYVLQYFAVKNEQQAQEARLACEKTMEQLHVRVPLAPLAMLTFLCFPEAVICKRNSAHQGEQLLLRSG